MPANPPENLRLTIELVPETCWYSNMRSALPRDEWDRLRRQVYADYGHRCGICGARGKLHCHERWHYDDAAHVQTLQGYIALCAWCHHVKQLRLSSIVETLAERNQQAVGEQWTSLEILTRLVQDEVERRAHKQLDLRVRRAAAKTLEIFDFTSNPTLSRQQLFDLASCAFVWERRNVLICGHACPRRDKSALSSHER
jgi:IstB-like ATP binding protein